MESLATHHLIGHCHGIVMDSHDAVWVFWLIYVVYIVVASPIGERDSRLALLTGRGRCCLVRCAGVVRAGMIMGLD